MLQLKRRNVSKAGVSKREVSAAQFIPYSHHFDKETIITKDNELLQIIRLTGFAFETADDEDVDMKKMVRNSLFKSLADGTFGMYFHTVRRKEVAHADGKMPAGFAREADDQWRHKHETRKTFVNELYVTIIRKRDTKGAAKVENLFKSIEKRTDKSSEDLELKEMHKELKEAVYRLLATFKDYGAKVLTTIDTENGPMSEPMEFLGRIVNGGYTQPMMHTNMEIARYLPINRLYFGDRAIEIRGPDYHKYAAVVGIKEYAPQTAAGVFDTFLQLPFEFIISQSAEFLNRQSNIGSMQTTQRRMMQAEDKAVSQMKEITHALDMATSGHIGFAYHHFTVLILEDDLQKLEAAVSMAIAELVNVGINPIREKLVMEASYWAQLPGNFDFVGRKARISTLNIAGFASMHNYPSGNPKKNHWGPAVTVFDTTSGTPYYFNFHARDVGHTTIIGPTGAGKTVLMNFLVAQAQKYNCRTFMFDKDRGAEIFVRALGGKYSIIDPGKRCGFNPLKLQDTMENRTFLAEWLKTLVTANDEPFTADDMDIIEKAVAGNFNLAPKDRVLRNIAPFLGMAKPGSLAGRLKMWHSAGQYAGIFDNEEDILDFDISTMFGFEMGELLASKTTMIPVLLYLFQRIQMSLDGTPTMIILDEAWALIDNKVFASKIKDWLKTLRKLNGMVVFATQSVEDAVGSSISDTLIQQTATQIFLPNPKATDAYRTAFMLSEREFNLLKTTDPGSRFFLVKQNKDVVVARIDLSGMDDIINVLSGRAETVIEMEKCIQEYGENPNHWVPHFCQRVRRG